MARLLAAPLASPSLSKGVVSSINLTHLPATVLNMNEEILKFFQVLVPGGTPTFFKVSEPICKQGRPGNFPSPSGIFPNVTM